MASARTVGSVAAAAGDTLLTLFADQVGESARRPALRYRSGGLWRAVSWREWSQTSRALSAALAQLGVQAGDRIAILSHTRREWVEADMAILLAGGATVPIYPSLRPDTVGEILRDSGARVIFVEGPTQLSMVLDSESGALPDLAHAVVFEEVSRLQRPNEQGRLDVRVEDVGHGSLRGVHTLASLLHSGAERLAENPEALAERAAAVQPDTLAAVYYTSGTSGEPKGVRLTHDNFVSETRGLSKSMPVDHKDEQLLFLPLAHIMAKLTMALQLRVGFVTSFAEGIEQAASDCQEVRPTFMVGVPRVFEKIQEAIEASSREGGDVQERVFEWALEVGNRVAAMRRRGERPGRVLSVQHRSAARLVYSRVQHRLGGRIRFMLSGAAPLARETAEFFHAMDLLILEGYGLSESTGASTVNTPTDFRFGTVGRPIPGLELRLADDGEVLLRGPSITRGYFGDAEATGRILSDGWLHTGDVGTLDADGYLTITDRKKDLIITAGGKNIAPQRVEMRLMRSPFIARAVVLGDRRKFAVALIELDVEAVAGWARAEGIEGDHAARIRHPAVRALLDHEVEKVNATLASYESVKRFEVLATGFGDVLTPTGKIKRRLIADRFADRVDSLYEGVSAELDDLS
ncbi:MAG: long-chain fatty acid--CoA ligase [Sandaracinaceae bacterium]